MVRRRRKRRKPFECGHRGFGQYCHRCEQKRRDFVQQSSSSLISDVVYRAKKSSRRHAWKQQFESDPIDLRHLPKPIVMKTRRILDLLDRGVAPGALQGKRFNFDRTLLRIPVSYRYRLLCRWQSGEIVPLQVLSHEAYNAVARNQKTPRLKKR